jgi:hypothetical protein
MKTLALIVIILASPIALLAQSEVAFGYDDAGNRTLREVIVLPPTHDGNDSLLKANQLFGTDEIAPEEQETSHTLMIDETYTISIFPNPNGGKFTVAVAGMTDQTVATALLTNISGSVVIEKPLAQQRTLIDISTSPAGTYLFTIYIAGHKETWKIVKQ